MIMRLEGKVAVITGAAQGIGFACAEVFAEHGARVVLADIQKEKCRGAAQQIADQTGVPTLGLACDVTDAGQVNDLIVRTLDRFDGLDIAVANAGTMRAGSILDLTPEDFDAVLNVNLRGVFLVGQAAARAMVERRVAGSIINMASTNAVVAIPGQLAYAASKGGVAQLTKVMALDLAEHNIRVNAIGPGSIQTDILNKVMTDDAARRMILSRTPMRRVGDPREIGTVAVFLASDYASYITGQTIYPDGGRLSLNFVVPVDD
jgi:NAD(P)-dependent dehydrogenase (short-subunit alcohol dehydrogenase family)